MVAVAAGTYPETLELGGGHDGVCLAGRCMELVVIDASVGDESTPGIDVAIGSSEVEVSGLTLSGSHHIGVLAGSGTTTIRDSAVLGSDHGGVVAYQAGSDATALTMEGCDVRGNTAIGVLAQDSGTSVTLRETAIEDTQPDGSEEHEYGIQVYGGASLVAETCEVRGNAGRGVLAFDSGTSVTLRETAVENTQPNESGEVGYGIQVYGGASLDAEACEIRENTVVGVAASDSGTSVTLRGTSVEDTQPDDNGQAGYGILISGGASVDAEDCEILKSTFLGVVASNSGTSVALRRTNIEGTQPDENGQGGVGIDVYDGAILEAEACEIRGNTTLGVLAYDSGTSVTLWETSIKDTQPMENGEGGFGIEVHSGARLDADSCGIHSNAAAGVHASGSGTSVSLWNTSVEDTQSTENGEDGFGINVLDGAGLEAEGCEIRGNTTAGVFALDPGTSVSLLETAIEDTQPDGTGEYGYGITVQDGASLDAEACEVQRNTGVGVVAALSGTSVTLRETNIGGTQPHENGSAGYGITVQYGASLDSEACDVGGNTAVGVAARDSGTSVTLRDTRIASTFRGEIQTVGIGVLGQLEASVEATGLDVCANQGPGFYAIAEDTYLTCSGCKFKDNQFAGAVVAWNATLDIADTLIEGTSEQENLGGGVGIYADPWLGGPPTLAVSDTTIWDNVIAGVWLSGPGSYSLSDNTIHGGEGWSRQSLTMCGDAVYARQGVTAWDGASGLLLERNELLDGLGAGLFLHDASASLSGNSYADNAVDLVTLGAYCATPPEGYEDEALGSAELCPAYDYATCGDEFALRLTLEEPETGHGAALAGPQLSASPVALPLVFDPLPLLSPAPCVEPPLRHERPLPPSHVVHLTH